MPAPTPDEVRETYDEFTDAYARIWGENLHAGYWDEGDEERPVPEATSRMTAELGSRLVCPPGGRVLDVGCGIGAPAFYLARERGLVVEGVTISGRQVERASRAAVEAALADRVTFRLADVTELPQSDGAFDAVWSLESLHHVVDRSRALREIVRVLRPGGRVVIADFALAGPVRDPDDAATIEAFRTAGGAVTLTEIDKYVSDLYAAGLTEVVAEDVSERVRPTMTWHARLFDGAREHLEPRMGQVALNEMIANNRRLAAVPQAGYVLLSARVPKRRRAY